MVIVIPCNDEPDLVGSLEALWNCEPPRQGVEVIVVINASKSAEPAIHTRNAQSLAEATLWAQTRSRPGWQWHFLHFPELPVKRAGVGLARKIGMDEALRRFAAGTTPTDGIIVGYDADCRCDSNYLQSIERHFEQHPNTPGCSIYFEHPLDGPLSSDVYRAITEYELHLRYYIQGLRMAGFPFAYHTVGSSMAVRASVYREQGGMNKRAAGEDFYFLHKVIPLGDYTDLTETTVRPSPRASHRVPFGTGRAVSHLLAGEPLAAYPLEAFQMLGIFLKKAPSLYHLDPDHFANFLSELPPVLGDFLTQNKFAEAWLEMREQATSPATFQKRFFSWFDGFRTMKFVHAVRDARKRPGRVLEEAARLWQLLYPEVTENWNERTLLDAYRRKERMGKKEEAPTRSRSAAAV